MFLQGHDLQHCGVSHLRGHGLRWWVCIAYIFLLVLLVVPVLLSNFTQEIFIDCIRVLPLLRIVSPMNLSDKCCSDILVTIVLRIDLIRERCKLWAEETMGRAWYVISADMKFMWVNWWTDDQQTCCFAASGQPRRRRSTFLFDWLILKNSTPLSPKCWKLGWFHLLFSVL